MNQAAASALRCLSLITLARSRPGIALSELAALAGMPVGAAARELANVAMLCGVPPYLPHQFVSVVFDRGRVTVSFADQFSRPIGLTALEVFALDAALDAVDDENPVAKALRGKLAALLPQKTRAAWGRLSQAKIPPAPKAGRHGQGRGRSTVWDSARVESRLVLASYRTPGREGAFVRELGPLGMFVRHGATYVVAFEPAVAKVKTFRLDRFESATMSEKPFDRPAGFRLADYVGPPKAAVRTAKILGLDRAAAAEAGAPTAEKGQAVAVKFADASAFAEHLLAKGGPDFEVLGPADLRNAVKRAAMKVRDAHSPPQVLPRRKRS